QELEWDVSSAFVANAASHIKPKENTKLGHQSRENIENQAGTKQVSDRDPRCIQLEKKGIKLAQEGHYVEAIKMFTEAIKCNPTDYRFFGNRSYCYECLEQYSSALIDAQTSIQLAPKWAKGHFRRGRALIGLKRYKEAAAAMEQVLKLDKDCKEAVTEIQNCKVLQLMERGFDETNSMLLLEKFSTVQAVLTSPEAAKGKCISRQQTPCSSLWVGNVTAELTDKHLWDLFQEFGEIESIRVLHERFCAFVNFKDASMAAQALEKVHGLKVENTKLVVRYPDRRVQRTLVLPSMLAPSGAQQAESAGTRRRGPVNGDECYFWRTTGCLFGDKCRYKHIPEHCGRDRKLPQT
ncbi:hsp70-Hsp90 organizing protein 1-like isoform X3, partial [Arapaima gigas]